MNNGDKGGITALIKLIRRKKTKKQKLENKTMNPIICIGNYYIDKKIKELMKVCNVFELKTPTNTQFTKLINIILPSTIFENKNINMEIILKYIQGDIRKLTFICEFLIKKPELITKEMIETIFHIKSYNEDSKKITQLLINKPNNIKDHNKCINETDRTIVALLWHENIVDMISNKSIHKSFPFYSKILENMCFSDYIDRITFQNQIWQFNEMSSLMKTFYNNNLYHKHFQDNANLFKPEEVRFTKILTKYSTEYNNMIFIYNLSQELELDKKDMITMFHELRLYFKKNSSQKFENINIDDIFENYNIKKLDIKRLYRYLDKNIKKDLLDDETNDDLDDL
jgi:DNA polymerase III delta prime subunit